MTYNSSAECPLFPDVPGHCTVLVALRRTVATISLLGCLFVILVIWVFRKYQAFVQRLILYLSCAAFFLCIAYLMGELHPDGPLCDFQSWWMTYFVHKLASGFLRLPSFLASGHSTSGCFDMSFRRIHLRPIADLRLHRSVMVTPLVCHGFSFGSQEHTETVHQYVAVLRRLSDSCDYGALKDDMIRDRLVIGTKDNAARARMLREPKLDLKKAVDTCLTSEISQEH
ncbi:hypothetical protein ScPMuIL_017755 [Solemya velum]